MPREFSRTRRVAELVRRELANLITSEISDPRISQITITAVEVSKDLRNAKVYITRLGEPSEPDKAQTLEALAHAAGFLRRELSHALTLKNTPALHFYYDNSAERGAILSALIDDACAKTKGRSGQG